MKLIRKIKKFLGLELPYLLEEEEEADIELQGNILKAPEGFYKKENWVETINQFSDYMSKSMMTANEVRELVYKLGGKIEK